MIGVIFESNIGYKGVASKYEIIEEQDKWYKCIDTKCKAIVMVGKKYANGQIKKQKQTK